MGILETLKGIIPDVNPSLLNYYVMKAQSYFLSTTNLDLIPDEANFIVIDLALIYLNKFGNEGLSSTSNSGITLNFGTDIPEDTKRSIAKYRRISW